MGGGCDVFYSYYKYLSNHIKSSDAKQSSTILIFMDNQVFFHGYKRRWSPSRSLMMFIFELCILQIQFKIHVRLEWISSASNGFSDALSRLLVDRKKYTKEFFRLCAMWGITNPQPIDFTYFTEFRLFNSNDGWHPAV
eukprot:1039091_1